MIKVKKYPRYKIVQLFGSDGPEGDHRPLVVGVIGESERS
jgi:hypothetical protein